jgi:hypothetical protein
MFVDNFMMQIVERHLLDDVSSLFKNVYTLSDDDIEIFSKRGKAVVVNENVFS